MMKMSSYFDRQHRNKTIAIILLSLIGMLAIASVVIASVDLNTGDGSDIEKDVDIRLPTAIKPSRYLIRLQPFLDGNSSTNGYTEITFDVLEATSKVTLHMVNIITYNETIMLTSVDDLNGPGLNIKKLSYDEDTDFFTVHLSTNLEAGEQYVLSMSFISRVNVQLYGLFTSHYVEDGLNKTIGVTSFEPTDARRVFPCFDEPAMKAEFEIYLARLSSMTAISNMPKKESKPFEDGSDWIWDHFNTSVPMSSYLVVFAISEFSYLNSTENDHVLFRVWARESAIDQAEFARDAGPAILTRYEEYFDIPFPLPKQDMIALPELAGGAMEDWGLITFLESAILYDKTACSESDKENILSTMAHELAHQWFGDLVTMEWWSDIWLNEGFAAYVNYIGTDSYEPTWGFIDEFVLLDLHVALALDCLESSHQISIPVQRPEEISQLFDTISYSKGSSILRMLNHSLTEETFRKGVTNYLNDHIFGNAAQDDLWSALTDQAHADDMLPKDVTVKKIMDTWTLQMGYPVLTVQVNGNGTATVSQERFLLAHNPNSTDTHDYKWWIPITFASEDTPNFDDTQPLFWIPDNTSTLLVHNLPKKGWVIFNTKQAGYYRVNYDGNTWDEINKQFLLDHNVIHRVSRSQILDDSMNLARGGLLPYSVALDLNLYLETEDEYIPWKAALTNMDYIEKMFTRTAAYGLVKKYLIQLLTPLYNKVGFNDNEDDPHQVQLLRVLTLDWSCKFGLEDCVKNAVNLFAKFMADPSNNRIITPNLRRTVYCNAIAAGGEEEWDFLWSQYLKTNVPQEKDRILRALGCSTELWILSRYLDMAFDGTSEVRVSDAGSVYSAVATNDIGRELAWDYLRNHVDDITTYIQTLNVVGGMISVVTSEFNTMSDLEELLIFEKVHDDVLGLATQAIEQSVEEIAINIAWMEKYYDTIGVWLEDVID